MCPCRRLRNDALLLPHRGQGPAAVLQDWGGPGLRCVRGQGRLRDLPRAGEPGRACADVHRREPVCAHGSAACCIVRCCSNQMPGCCMAGTSCILEQWLAPNGKLARCAAGRVGAPLPGGLSGAHPGPQREAGEGKSWGMRWVRNGVWWWEGVKGGRCEEGDCEVVGSRPL